MKYCRGCKTEKPFAEWGKNKSMKDGLQTRCKSCRNLYAAQDRAINPERQALASARHYAKNSDEIIFKGRFVRKKYYKANRAKRIAYVAQWQRDNPDKCREKAQRRRARRRAAEIDDHTREEIYLRDKGVCQICKLIVDPMDWHLDHVVPLARGGSHVRSNVQVTHPRCNLEKATKILDQG